MVYTEPTTGAGLPSVSEILKAARLIPPLPPCPEALERGRGVHELCALVARGLPLPPDIGPRALAFAQRWADWLSLIGGTVESVEEPVISLALGYGGTPDAVLLVDGRRILVDIKTGVPQLWHWLQLAAYAMLLASVGRPVGVYYPLYVGEDYVQRGGCPWTRQECDAKWAVVLQYYHLAREIGALI